MKKRIRYSKFRRFLKDVATHTPFIRLLGLMLLLWILFSSAMYFAERTIAEPAIRSFGEALYWGVAAFSTAGIADMPQSRLGQLLGAIWIVVGSMLFFGTIVASITGYFMRPMQRPAKRIIDTIEFNLEQLDDLTLEELDLLKQTVDTLIAHVEHLKETQ